METYQHKEQQVQQTIDLSKEAQYREVQHALHLSKFG